ncbi:hypothetical protein H6761_02575 [Candidatus Nomurabacteria bacterium]|nr:hypothetical protein [Candidatus Nomurabacteria bacterium]
MKKKIFIIIFATFLFTGFVSTASAAICFKPSIEIPGMSAFFKKCTPTVLDASGKEIVSYEINGYSVGNYVNALYNYGASAAGAVAMFMIVFASWQWIIASGNAGKIDNAKDTIRGALIGLALLFGGYLLLNSISSNLVNFEKLNISEIGTKYMAKDMCIAALNNNEFGSVDSCGSVYATSTSVGFVQCVDNSCPSGSKCWEYDERSNRIGECPSAIDINENVTCSCARQIPCQELTLDNCSEYNRFQDQEACALNSCYNRVMANGETFSSICGLSRANVCLPAANSDLEGKNCSSNSECLLDTNGDGVSEYCCDNEDYGVDECELKTWVSENDGHRCYN